MCQRKEELQHSKQLGCLRLSDCSDSLPACSEKDVHEAACDVDSDNDDQKEGITNHKTEHTDDINMLNKDTNIPQEDTINHIEETANLSQSITGQYTGSISHNTNHTVDTSVDISTTQNVADYSSELAESCIALAASDKKDLGEADVATADEGTTSDDENHNR